MINKLVIALWGWGKGNACLCGYKWYDRQSSSNIKGLLPAILFAIKYRICERVVVNSPLLRLECGLLCLS